MKEIIIWDCRKKECFLISRVGGDLAIVVCPPCGLPKERYWFEMKKPANKNFKKILVHFKAIQKLLERQDE